MKILNEKRIKNVPIRIKNIQDNVINQTKSISNGFYVFNALFGNYNFTIDTLDLPFQISCQSPNIDTTVALDYSDQIDSLNMDFRRLNADAAQTPAPFQALGGDAEIEFRLATLDPNGNCTDGVVRLYSSLTNDARNNVKALSYWPSNKYLNILIINRNALILQKIKIP